MPPSRSRNSLDFFAGQRILITGGSAGIGLSMSIELARRGAVLALLARDAEKLEAACQACREVGGQAFAYPCDVTRKEEVAATMAQAHLALGGLDGVIANPGYCHPGYFEATSLEDADRQLDTNIKGTVYTLHTAIPLLSERGGFLAITSSPAGSLSVFGFALYGSTKAALNHLAHTLRHEYAARGIRVHLLLPPDTDTPGYQNEITLYPEETRAVLSGGKLHLPDNVARQFVDGIARGRSVIAVGFEGKLAMLLTRLWPGFWERYTRRKIRLSRRNATKP